MESAGIREDEKLPLDNDTQLIINKRKEVNEIQNELNILMGRLNGFVDENKEYSQDDSESEFEEREDDSAEKMPLSNAALLDELYIADELNPPEINWKFVLPIFQKQLSDLAKLQDLNSMVHSVVQKIRNVTQKPKPVEDSDSGMSKESSPR